MAAVGQDCGIPTSAVDVAGEGLLIAPTVAVSELLKRNGLKLQILILRNSRGVRWTCALHDEGVGVLLNTAKHVWDDQEPLGKIDRSKLNVRGSSIALGHPFATTGAKIVGVLAKILHSAGPGKRGLIVVCTAGGMGVATILES